MTTDALTAYDFAATACRTTTPAMAADVLWSNRPAQLSAWTPSAAGRDCCYEGTGAVHLSEAAGCWRLRCSVVDWQWSGTGGKPGAEAAFGRFWAAHEADLTAMADLQKRLFAADQAVARTRNLAGSAAKRAVVAGIHEEIAKLTAKIRAWKA